MSLANISIVGNLVRDPEQFQFASGRSKTTLVIAVNSFAFNKSKKEKITDFYKVETWDRLADLAKTYLHKGNQVTVSGRLALEKWSDRAGKDRITPTVQANQLAFPPRLKPYPDEIIESSESEVLVGSTSVVESPVVPPPEVDSEPHSEPDFDIEDAVRHESDVEPPAEGEIVRIPYDDPHSQQKTA